MTREHLAFLQQLGVSRLHVGVQTLDDAIRPLLGRHEDGATVCMRLRDALEMGFVTTVDIIYGLPGQDVASLLSTLELLTERGVQGFSLYALQQSARNARFHQRHFAAGRDSGHDFFLFAAAERYLRERGFRKNHFTHFARPVDRNLYYTYPQRGEDLLALGPTADGILGTYRYRHHELPGYLNAATAADALMGGIDDPSTAIAIRNALCSGTFSPEEAQLLKPLLTDWVDRALLTPVPEGYSLSVAGSWYIERMLAELEDWPGVDKVGR